jgi:HSP20 family protein
MSSLIRFEPAVATLSDLFDEALSGNFFSRWNRELPETTFPNVDIVEGKDGYNIKADMPGLDKKDIKVEIEKGVLTISGEKKEEKIEQEKNHYYHLERTYGSFRRSFKLPDNVSSEHIDAKYNSGVLELTLKKTEEAKPKTIEVKIE